MSDTILVFGAGRLSENLKAYFPNVKVLPKEVCDITNRDAVVDAIKVTQPSIVLNTAAITSPALCEKDFGLAWRVNVFGARNVAWACRAAETYSIHISSNWAADPVNEYGRSKYVSEYVGFDLVVRTCYYDQAYWVLSSLARGDPITLVESDEFNPISITGLLQVLERIFQKRLTGLINVGVTERLSHFDFGVMLGRTFGFPLELIRPTREVNTSYEYPYTVYLEPHPLSRIGVVADLKEFRSALAWASEEEGAEEAASSSDDRDSRSR